MGDSSVAELADVQETLDAAEIDEGAVGGERGHRAAHRLADLDALARRRSLGLGLLFEQRPARQHEIHPAPPALLETGDAKSEPLADVDGGVLDVA